jgi:hypothetical protein
MPSRWPWWRTNQLLDDTIRQVKHCQLHPAVILVAALGHDLGHPGLNNPFLISSKHALIDHYPKTSPLENMHLAYARRLLEACALDLAPFSQGHAKQMTELILATDMAHHN